MAVSLATAPTTPVTGTFFQATQPVTNDGTFAVQATLAAETTKVIGTVNVAAAQTLATVGTVSAITAGPVQASGFFIRVTDGTNIAVVKEANTGAVAADPALVVAISPNNREIFRGRAGTFRTPGRAGTVGQNILSIHNATGSTITLVVNKVFVDLMQTVVKAVTVAPPIMRLWKVTVLPTNGAALTKNKIGGSGASNADVTLLQDASADGTGAGTTLTATRPAGTIISQEFAPRLITAVGYENADRVEWLGDTEVVLAPLEGLVLFLDYVLATQNPTTDMWIAGIEWYEYTT